MLMPAAHSGAGMRPYSNMRTANASNATAINLREPKRLSSGALNAMNGISTMAESIQTMPIKASLPPCFLMVRLRKPYIPLVAKPNMTMHIANNSHGGWRTI